MQRSFEATGAVNKEMQKAGVWVFGGGLRHRQHDDRQSKDGEVTMTDGPLRRDQGVPRRLLDHRRPRPRRRAEVGGQGERGLPGAVEVRPFQGE